MLPLHKKARGYSTIKCKEALKSNQMSGGCHNEKIELMNQ